jgi:hypothetical protein
MRWILLAALAASLPAAADLYRWVDPQSGSVKFSSVPPDWHGDPLREGVAPRVEVLRHQGPAPASLPPGAAEKPRAAPAQAALEERWRNMLQFLATMPQRADFDRAGRGLQQQIEAFQAVRADLDRLDPDGAPRRRVEEANAFERLKNALEAQVKK